MQTKSIGGGHGEDLMTKLSLDYQQSYHYISLAKEKKKKKSEFCSPFTYAILALQS